MEIVEETMMKLRRRKEKEDQWAQKTMLELRGEPEKEEQWAQELFHPEKGLSERFKDGESFWDLWEREPTLVTAGVSMCVGNDNILAKEMDNQIEKMFLAIPHLIHIGPD
ncbi:hypothetical protein PTTG_27781 [Puccinia triticina 1-1 BBBD Race 1]|uniref:Uncharacterized protein n=1 Tax=Puccinia triticina (isolate 1-1 / race 1 (BBBD)) TaxID=630390 RepID=A0A180GHY6_PUCT1|nr:hypothetical protein PTTG_27781 [Puccinia triticina 1-1 BBBD Race 1]WAR63352.1 hypothetical protein PtB15_18B435 [Puccinia triticina]